MRRRVAGTRTSCANSRECGPRKAAGRTRRLADGADDPRRAPLLVTGPPDDGARPEPLRVQGRAVWCAFSHRRCAPGAAKGRLKLVAALATPMFGGGWDGVASWR